MCLTVSELKSPRHSPQGLKESLGSIPGLLSSQACTALLSALSRTDFFHAFFGEVIKLIAPYIIFYFGVSKEVINFLPKTRVEGLG